MTTQEALSRWTELSQIHEKNIRRVQEAEDFATPVTNSMAKIRAAMTVIQGELCDLGVNNRMDITLGDIVNLLRSCDR